MTIELQLREIVSHTATDKCSLRKRTQCLTNFFFVDLEYILYTLEVAGV